MSFGYDVAGNLTNDASHNYTYDAEGNLRQVDNTLTALYDYDAVGRRVKTATPSLTTEYLFDPFGHRISSWVLDGSSVGTGREGRILWGDQLLATRNWDGSTFFHHSDTLGTERARTDATGNVATMSTSEPFGDGFSQTSSDTYGAAQDNREFAQLDSDFESGTEHADFRQYSPTQGRWMSPDPYNGSYDLSNPQSMNRYAYVMNNPLSATDPSGLTCEGNCGGGDGGDDGTGGIFDAIWDAISGLFGRPQFHGSTTPRPEGTGVPDYKDPLNESLGYPKGGPQLGGNWLSTPLGSGCEFGACGFQDPAYPNGHAPSMNPLPYVIPSIVATAGQLWRGAVSATHFASVEGVPGCSTVGLRNIGKIGEGLLDPRPSWSTPLTSSGDMKAVGGGISVFRYGRVVGGFAGFLGKYGPPAALGITAAAVNIHEWNNPTQCR